MKEATISKLDDALDKGLVDREVVPLLEAINRLEDAVTTSSCSGRFQLIQVPNPGDKLNSNVLGKWHRKIESGEVMEALGRWDGTGQVHFLVQPLLVHIRCRNIETASRLRNLAHGSGLKFSTIRSMKTLPSGGVPEWGVVVEFLGTERMEVPLHIFPREDLESIVPPLINHGNELMERIKLRIPAMIDSLIKEFLKYHVKD